MLWPYDFKTHCKTCQNEVIYNQDYKGFYFYGPGIVIDNNAETMIHRYLANTQAITIALRMRSDALLQNGPARILSLSADPSNRNFTIGQERDNLVFRLRTPLTGPNGNDPPIIARGVIRSGEFQLFVTTYDGDVFRIYADGRLVNETMLEAGPLLGWDSQFPLIYGNEATGNRPWLGHVLDAAIYARALDPEQIVRLGQSVVTPDARELVYHLGARCASATAPERTEDATVIGTCRVPDQYVNEHELYILRLGLRAPTDYLLNFALWLPFGVLISMLSDGRFYGCRSLAGIGLVLMLAVGIELGQAPIYSRTSSAHDLGAALAGLVVGLFLIRRRNDRRTVS